MANKLSIIVVLLCVVMVTGAKQARGIYVVCPSTLKRRVMLCHFGDLLVLVHL